MRIAKIILSIRERVYLGHAKESESLMLEKVYSVKNSHSYNNTGSSPNINIIQILSESKRIN